MKIPKSYVIRKATLKDLNEIKELADAYKRELGFILRPTIVRSIEKGELIVATNNSSLVGFVQYHHRRDTQTTLHNLVIKKEDQGYGVGKQLVRALESEALFQNKQFVLLKCPEELSANGFYNHMGYKQITTESGKHRRLMIWQKALRPLLVEAQT